jgi:predicted dehydrogenase
MQPPPSLKCLIAGVGSIGRRHLRNLRAAGVSDFVLLRRSGSGGARDEGELDGLRTETDLQAALAHGPGFAVIANPTSLHLATALACARAGCHLLIEKPVGHTLEGSDELMDEARSRGLVVMVGFQFRFHPGLRRVKQLIEADEIGPVVSAQAHWGEYLPAWHPWEDHRQSYSAREDLGGGVTLTLCHPFDYLRWLLGEVREVAAMTGRRGGLGIEAEDTADVQLLFESGAAAHVHLDYVQRPPGHWLQITGQRGLLRWDNADGAVRLFRAGPNAWEEFPAPSGFERNAMFADEAQHFLQCVAERRQPLCTLADGVAALRVALAAKESSREGRRVKLGESAGRKLSRFARAAHDAAPFAPQEYAAQP